MPVRALLGLLILAVSCAGDAAGLQGRLVLFADGKPLRAEEASEAVIYFRPARPALRAAPTQPVLMVTRRKQFQPRLLPVVVGSRVRFPNEDPILHNVFSTSPDNSFDAGLYGNGAGVEHLFANPGLVKVYCNVHHSMFGFILVLDTPHFTRADKRGAFGLTNISSGEGDLVVFHDRAQPWRSRVDPLRSGPLDIRLDLNKRKVPQHMNKFGRPYGASGNDRGY